MGTTLAIISCDGNTPAIKDTFIMLVSIQLKLSISEAAFKAPMFVSEVVLSFKALIVAFTSTEYVGFK